MLALGSEIYGSVENSVISSNVVIEEGAVVKDSVIMSGSVIRSGASVSYSIIDENVIVEDGAQIGEAKEEAKGISVLGRNITVGKGVEIKGGDIIDKSIEGEVK